MLHEMEEDQQQENHRRLADEIREEQEEEYRREHGPWSPAEWSKWRRDLAREELEEHQRRHAAQEEIQAAEVEEQTRLREELRSAVLQTEIASELEEWRRGHAEQRALEQLAEQMSHADYRKN